MTDIHTRVHDSERENDVPSGTAVLPTQFYSARRTRRSIEPLQRLMFALLVDGIRCFQTSLGAQTPGGRQQFAEAQSWIFSNAHDEVFSFNTVCDTLDIDSERLRSWLLGWRDQRLAGQPPGTGQVFGLPLTRRRLDLAPNESLRTDARRGHCVP